MSSDTMTPNFEICIETLVEELKRSNRWKEINTLVFLDCEFSILATPVPSPLLWCEAFIKKLPKVPFDWYNIEETMPSAEYGLNPHDFIVPQTLQRLQRYCSDPSCLVIFLSNRCWRHWEKLNNILTNELELEYDLLLMRDKLPELETPHPHPVNYALQYKQTILFYLLQTFPQFSNIHLYDNNSAFSTEMHKMMATSHRYQNIVVQLDFIPPFIKFLPSGHEYEMVRKVVSGFDARPYENLGIPLSSPLGDLRFINLIKARTLAAIRMDPAHQKSLCELAKILKGTPIGTNWVLSSLAFRVKVKIAKLILKQIEENTVFEMRPVKYGVFKESLIAFKFEFTPNLTYKDDTLGITMIYNPNVVGEFDVGHVQKYEDIPVEYQTVYPCSLYSLNQYDLKISYQA